MIDTELCSLLDLDHPLIQSPIGSASTPELAATVADAGGLGTLAMSWREREEIRDALGRAMDASDGTIAANVVLDKSTGVLSPSDCLDVCLDAGAEVISLSFGDPTPYLDRIRDAGATAIVTVGSAEAATAAVDAGADAVVAQGWEAGGHVQSEVATMALLPQVADAVEVPVVAAGGIANGRGLAAALALGGDGVWMGTRFVATPESGAHERYRDAVAAASERDTTLTDLFDGGWPDQPHRVLENETVDAWCDAGRPDAGDRPSEGDVVAETSSGDPVERYEDLPPIEELSGDVEALPQYAGQSAGGTDAVVPAGTVVEEVVAEATAAIEKSAGTFVA